MSEEQLVITLTCAWDRDHGRRRLATLRITTPSDEKYTVEIFPPAPNENGSASVLLDENGLFELVGFLLGRMPSSLSKQVFASKLDEMKKRRGENK